MRARVVASVVRWRANYSAPPSWPAAVHIKLGRIVLENRFPKNLVQVAVILDDFRHRFEAIKHAVSFGPTNNFLIACLANSENATASRTNSNLELRSSGALANRGMQPGLIHMKLFSFGA
jgi:hypothetical protein